VISINTRPLGDALTQQTEPSDHRHQQKNQTQRPEGSALNRVHSPLEKTIDLGLIRL